MGFETRRILVTGAGGSIGSAVVRRLCELGAQVIAADGAHARVATLCAETGSTPIAFDLTDESSVRSALDGLDIDGLVNCAGVGGEIATPQDTDIDVFDQTIAVNARGALLVIKHAAASLIRSPRGAAIVNISSQASLVALPGHVSYAASKAALDSITRSSALELGRYGVRVNSVNPTALMNPMSLEYWSQPEIERPFLASMPLGRWATERDIVGPVVFLLSDEAAMITGVCLAVDGGYSIQ
jgi:NAD(P)-dependent dehydrogenase (short-subunit alcohol dehydrogenase family)